MEVNDFVSHILEDSVEGEVVMLPQTQFKEGHVSLFGFLLITQFVVEEAAKELGVSLLRVDCQGFSVLSALTVVMRNSLRVCLEHTKEHKQ